MVDLVHSVTLTTVRKRAVEGTRDRQFWDSFANGIANVPQFLVVFAERVLAEAALPAGSKVLDIATGTGTMALVAARAGFDVTATDFSSTMVERVASYKIANIEARVMDGQALDLPDGSFDAAFSMFGVTLFADWHAGLCEMARVIRSGGTATIGTWALPGGAAGSRLLYELCNELFPGIDEPATMPGLVELARPGPTERGDDVGGLHRRSHRRGHPTRHHHRRGVR